MTLCFNLAQGALSSSNCSSYEIHSALSLLPLNKLNKSCSQYYREIGRVTSMPRFFSHRDGNGGGLWCCAVLPPYDQGQSWCYKKNLSTHTNSSKISQGGAELPEKVILVRFDASILLLEDVEKHTVLLSNAVFTIKYLYEAGARVILMSNWSTKGNYKLRQVQDVADHLSSTLQLKVVPANCISIHMKFKVEGHGNRHIILLDDLSNLKEELANDLDFAESLSCDWREKSFEESSSPALFS